MAETSRQVMVVVAHPDDAEVGCGGSVAKWVKEGREVTYVIATNGDKGSSDRTMTSERLIRIREEEQRNAARVLGVERVRFLGYPDGELENTREVRRDMVAEIRRWRPDLIVTHNPNRTFNLFASHRDHRTTAAVVLDCVYPLARDYLSFPELIAQGLEPHKVREVYMMWGEDSDTVIDISDTLDLKLKALACHRSQFDDFAQWEVRIRERSAELGKAKGYQYAETFRRIAIPR